MDDNNDSRQAQVQADPSQVAWDGFVGAVSAINHGVEMIATELLFAFSPLGTPAHDNDDYGMENDIERKARLSSAAATKRKKAKKLKPQTPAESKYEEEVEDEDVDEVEEEEDSISINKERQPLETVQEEEEEEEQEEEEALQPWQLDAHGILLQNLSELSVQVPTKNGGQDQDQDDSDTLSTLSGTVPEKSQAIFREAPKPLFPTDAERYGYLVGEEEALALKKAAAQAELPKISLIDKSSVEQDSRKEADADADDRTKLTDEQEAHYLSVDNHTTESRQPDDEEGDESDKMDDPLATFRPKIGLANEIESLEEQVELVQSKMTKVQTQSNRIKMTVNEQKNKNTSSTTNSTSTTSTSTTQGDKKKPKEKRSRRSLELKELMLRLERVSKTHENHKQKLRDANALETRQDAVSDAEEYNEVVVAKSVTKKSRSTSTSNIQRRADAEVETRIGTANKSKSNANANTNTKSTILATKNNDSSSKKQLIDTRTMEDRLKSIKRYSQAIKNHAHPDAVIDLSDYETVYTQEVLELESRSHGYGRGRRGSRIQSSDTSTSTSTASIIIDLSKYYEDENGRDVVLGENHADLQLPILLE